MPRLPSRGKSRPLPGPLDVTVGIIANRGYQILRDELAAVGVHEVGRCISRMFDVVEPKLDWVALDNGHGVEAVRVTDMAGFNPAFEAAMSVRGAKAGRGGLLKSRVMRAMPKGAATYPATGFSALL